MCVLFAATITFSYFCPRQGTMRMICICKARENHCGDNLCPDGLRKMPECVATDALTHCVQA